MIDKDTVRDAAILTSTGLSVLTASYVAFSAIANNTQQQDQKQPSSPNREILTADQENMRNTDGLQPQ